MAELDSPTSPAAQSSKAPPAKDLSRMPPFLPSPRGRIWLIIAALLAVVGLAISIYSIVHHREVKALGLTDAACNINATINCDEVAKSKFSEIGGIPLGVFGFGYFAASLVLAVIGMLGLKASREHLYGYVALVGIGVVCSLILGGISFVQLGAVCLACVAIYAVTVAQAVAVGVYRTEIPKGFNLKETFSGGTTAVIVVAAVIAGYSWLLPPAKPAAGRQSAAAGKDMPALSPQKHDIPITRSAFSGLGEDYRKGNDAAKVVIVEFADFQCPACKQVSASLGVLAKEYGDRIQVVFRNFPLDSSCNPTMQGRMHDYACDAAIMARCAGQYGKFWQMHDLLFDNQRDLSEANIKASAKKLGLADEQINACWKNPDAIAKIREDVEVANKIGVDATPTLFINGQKVVGSKGINELKSEIDKALQ